MVPSRLRRARIATYKFFAVKLRCSVFVHRLATHEAKLERARMSTLGGEAILLYKYRVPLDNAFFETRVDELAFLQGLTYDKYLTIKKFIEILHDEDRLYYWSTKYKIDPFLKAALGMQEIGTETGHSPSLLMGFNVEENRRDRLLEFVNVYGELIERMERCPILEGNIKDETAEYAKAENMCIYDCFPDYMTPIC